MLFLSSLEKELAQEVNSFCVENDHVDLPILDGWLNLDYLLGQLLDGKCLNWCIAKVSFRGLAQKTSRLLQLFALLLGQSWLRGIVEL